MLHVFPVSTPKTTHRRPNPLLDTAPARAAANKHCEERATMVTITLTEAEALEQLPVTAGAAPA